MSQKTIAFLRQQIRKERQRIKVKPRRGLATMAYDGNQVPADGAVGLGSQPEIGSQMPFPARYEMIGGRQVMITGEPRAIVDWPTDDNPYEMAVVGKPRPRRQGYIPMSIFPVFRGDGR
jgi:hypothetical protein